MKRHLHTCIRFKHEINESGDADNNDGKMIMQLMMMNCERKVNCVKLSVVQRVRKVK